jgi:hypothetical protein
LKDLQMAITDDVATTVVAVDATDLPDADQAIPALLVDIATRHELVIVYAQSAGGLTPQGLLQAVRALLPRWRVTSVFVDAPPRLAEADVRLIDELVNEGTLAVAVTADIDPGPTAEALAIRMGADHALRLVFDQDHGLTLEDLRVPPVPTSGAG